MTVLTRSQSGRGKDAITGQPSYLVNKKCL
jgi:hypothetical protein